MQDNLSIAAVQAAARTHNEFDLTPLAGFQQNRLLQVLEALPDLHDADYEAVREVVAAAYHAGWHDSRLTLGEL